MTTLSVKLDRISKVFPLGVSSTGELMSAVSAHNGLDKKNEGKVAVNEVSLNIGEGERLGIVGRNGAGKSTLLHLIAGISQPSAGKIEINGKVTSIMTLGVGLRDELSGRENIYVDGEIQGKSRESVDQVIDDIIEFSELGKFIEYPVRTYSTGMKARLAFSMITHIEPEILIIDEALSVGDAYFSAKATARIMEICSRGKIVILVSHGMQSIRDICNRCIYLKDGQIVLDGLPEEVTKAYIDEVRQEDEAKLLKQFSAHVGEISFRAGSQIERVAMYSGSDLESTAKVEVARPLRIHVVATDSSVNENTMCQMSIVRLDSVLLFQKTVPVQQYVGDDGRIGIEFEFSSFVLGCAIYRLDISLVDESNHSAEVCAQYTTVFEAFTLSPPSGGKPMLIYPVGLTSTKIMKNGE